MDYTVDKSNIKDRVEELIARIAASQYSDDGVSLYDSIVNSSADDGIIDGYIDEAVGGIIARLASICKVEENNKLIFNVPEMVEANKGRAQSILDQYIFHYAINRWCDDKVPTLAKKYFDLAADDLNKAVILIKTRKIPARV